MNLKMSIADHEKSSSHSISHFSVTPGTSENDCRSTYVIIAPPQNYGATLSIQTKEDTAEVLLGSELEESDITALVVEEDDLNLTGQSQQPASTSSISIIGWSKAAVLKLIQLHKVHQHLFDDPHYKKKSVWEMVALCMQKENYPYTWIQAENKWKSITKKYRDTVDHNTKHRHILQRKCPFYSELSAVYDYTSPYQCQSPMSSQTALKYVLSNSHSVEQRSTDMVTAQLSSSVKRLLQPHGSSQAKTILMKKKKYNPTSTDVSDVGQVLHLLHILSEDQRKQEKIRMDRLEKMHQEKMAILREFLDVLKESVNKDSDSIKNEGALQSGE